MFIKHSSTRYCSPLGVYKEHRSFKKGTVAGQIAASWSTITSCLLGEGRNTDQQDHLQEWKPTRSEAALALVSFLDVKFTSHNPVTYSISLGTCFIHTEFPLKLRQAPTLDA